MKAIITFGNGKINKINTTIEFDGTYNDLLYKAHEALYRHSPRWGALDDELVSWMDTANDLIEQYTDDDFCGCEEYEFTEELAKKFLKRRSGANGRYGFNYEILED